jgi:membrane associated rhomboid family serine protease
MSQRPSPAVIALLWSNGIVFALQSLLHDAQTIAFALWPLGEYPIGYHAGQLVTIGFLPWQLLTYGFLHGSLMHLGFNMLALWMFGTPLEATFGTRRFLQFYLVCVLGAGLVQLCVATWAVSHGEDPYPTVGASGGVFGLLLAFGMLYPQQRVMLLFPPIPMKAWVFVLGYGVLELVLGVTGSGAGVAHFAHLGGMAFGFLLLQYWRGRWPFRKPRHR